MKKIIITIIFCIWNAIASCPKCEIDANSNINFSPYIINSNNQNVNLSLTLNCPRNTIFHSFTGYTIDWGDGVKEDFYYNLTKKKYDDCIAKHRTICSPNPYENSYRNNLSAMTTLSKTHTYTVKKNYDIQIEFTTIQKKNDSFVSCETYANVATDTKTIKRTIISTPIDYCLIPKGYALFATNALRMNDRVSCSKKDASEKFCKVGSENSYNLGVKGLVDEAHINGTAVLRNNSIVYSGIWANVIDAQNGAQYTKKGMQTTFNFNANVSNVNFINETDFIESKKTKSYEPGVYGDVTIRNGGTLVLNSDGVYEFKSLKFEYGSILKIKSSGVKEIYTNEFNFSGNVQEAIASKLLVGITGTADSFIENAFTGSVWAPNAKLVLGQMHLKTYNGSYMAKQLIIHQDSKINYVPFVNNEACK